MNIRIVIRVVSSLMIVIGVAMATSVPVGWLMGDAERELWQLGLSAAAVIVVSGLLRMLIKPEGAVGFREGFGIVTFSWLFASLSGAVPFVWGADLHWYDAVFETMSGFTTTGASVLDASLPLTNGETLRQGIKDLPFGLIYWRNLTQWLGGMGIVVLSLVILPSLGIGAHQLYRAEVSGPTEAQFTPRIAESAKILWLVYLLFSVLEAALLYAGGMPLFDAWCNTCGTMATGGFSPSQASIGGYESLYLEMVIVAFMFLAGSNFILHYRALCGRPISYFRDEEFLFYFAVMVGVTLMLSVVLTGTDIETMTGDISDPDEFHEEADTLLTNAGDDIWMIASSRGY